ncbi:MAG TPA: PVC-type heme-binding CxxCH protein [Verrucomicrobiales bacterium]|nr:PVC-type heme-binding CxxCH protein [Verrucomicrobiales bacterium]
MPSRFSPLFLCVPLLSSSMAASAAEPEVNAGELPRVPPMTPEKALASFKIRPGFRIELAACEPEVADPVAMAFDENSVLYVVEMIDYSERRNEKLSRVRRLEDRDGDGRFEHSTVFMDGLPWATAIACWDGGVFVGASPDIFYAKDTTGDGVADERRVVFTGFGAGRTKLNVQALLNSFAWGPDRRIHGAAAGNGGKVERVVDGKPQGGAVNVDGADFSFDPLTLDFRAETGTAQFGLTFDEYGEKYVCSNSSHLLWCAYTRRDSAVASPFPLPAALVSIPLDGPAAEVFRISAEEPWRVVRTRWRASGLVPGIVEGGGRSSGYFTSASGVHISGGLVCRGSAFAGDVGSNLVHRKNIEWTPNGPVARRGNGEEHSEFLASPDNWFRPVAFATGPDGGLYIADMYREDIEHPDSLPPAIKKHLDLNSGNDKGRIWRVVPERFVRKPWPKLSGLKDAELAALPPDTNWHTATASRLLHARKSPLNTMPPPSLPEAERAARAAIHTALEAGRGNATARAQMDSFFHLPDKTSADGWKPGLLPELARHALATREEAAVLFQKVSAGRGALASMQLAAFLEIPLPPELLTTARQWLINPDTAESLRLAAVDALSRGNAKDLEAVALAAGQPPAVRAAALRYVPSMAGQVLETWESQPSAVRNAALEKLAGSAAGARQLLKAVEGSKIPAQEIPSHLADQLRRVYGAEIKALAMKLLPPPAANRQAVIEARQGALKIDGDAAKGRALFLQVCATCHRDGKDGAAVGPDRISFRNLGKPTLLLHVLDPNREVAPRFFTAVAATETGETFAGILAEESATTLRILMPGGTEKILQRSQIKKLDRSNRSLMPEGLEAAWNDNQLADLLAFLVQ